MSTTTSSVFLAYIAEQFSSVVSNLTNTAAPTLAKLPKKLVPADVWNFDVKTGGADAAWAASGASYPTSSSDSISQAVVPLQTLHGRFGIDDRALATAANGVNPSAFGNLFAEKLSEKLNLMLGGPTYSIDAALFSGTGSSNQIFGLKKIAATDTNLYGINQAVTTAFQGNVVNAGGDALTATDLSDAINAVVADTNQRPELLVCNPTVYGYIMKLGLADRIFAGNVVDPLAPGVTVSGIPLVVDANETDGYIYGIGGIASGETYLAMQNPVATNADTWVIPSVANPAGMLSVPFLVKRLGVSGSAEEYGIATTVALVAQKPNAIVRLFNFTAP